MDIFQALLSAAAQDRWSRIRNLSYLPVTVTYFPPRVTNASSPHVSHQLCPFGQVSPIAAAFLIFYVIITVSWPIWMKSTAAELVFSKGQVLSTLLRALGLGRGADGGSEAHLVWQE